ncbi:MAG: MBOAT family O-acyltransferase [Bdellovibrionota bacterium]
MLVDFVIAQVIFNSKDTIKIKSFSIEKRRFWLIISVILNIFLLGYYKYSNFLVNEINQILTILNIKNIPWKNIVLPIGISFITFQKISYLVDVYRKTVKPASNFLNYLLYISFFPPLIAGPIVRYKDIEKQIEKRKIILSNIWKGTTRFCTGLAKKVLIADTLGAVVSNVDKLGADSITAGYAWLGITCYSLQLYFDFSGYSDMAIGLAKVFGFNLLENFNKPYASQTFTEFWRRWHISLQRFMKDYVYIPLGGNRVSKIRSYINLWIVFLISGFWHGANWTFIAWGAYHGLFLTIDKMGWYKKSNIIGKTFLGKVFNTFLAIFFIQIGWVLFKSKNIKEAFNYIGYMFNFFKTPTIYPIQARIIHSEAVVVLIIAIAIILSHILFTESKFRKNRLKKLLFLRNRVVQFTYSIIILIICTTFLCATNFSPFIYFQF